MIYNHLGRNADNELLGVNEFQKVYKGNHILLWEREEPFRLEHYGMKILKSASTNDDVKCVYIHGATGFTPKTLNSIGSWGDAFFVRKNYPVMCLWRGEEDYRLSPSDHSKKLDGTASDVSNANYTGNAMSCFDCVIWMKFTEDSNYYYIEVANYQVDDQFVNYPYKRCDFQTKRRLPDATKLYYPMFEGTIPNVLPEERTSLTLIRSIAGYKASGGLNATDGTQFTFWTESGRWWNIMDWSHYLWMTVLMLLMGKTTDIQKAFGKGKCSATGTATSSEEDFAVNGELMKEGQFYGSTDETKPMKAFYCENVYGNRYKRVHGLYNGEGTYYSTIYPEDYNVSGNFTYYNCGSSPSSSGFIESIRLASTLFGKMPVPSGTTSADNAYKYFPDYITRGNSGKNTACVGGRVGTSDPARNGPLNLMLNKTGFSSSWYIGQSPMLWQPYHEE